jgi:hypothetical protein
MAEICQVNRVSVCHVIGLISITCYPFFTGVTALATAIPDMGALLRFDISNNQIRAEGGKALAGALKGNQVITTLNIAGNHLSANSSGKQDTSGVAALADAIPGMGALSSLNLSGNNLGGLVLPEGWRSKGGISRAVNYPWIGPDGQEQNANPKKPLGSFLIAEAVSNMGALTSLNLASNDLNAKGVRIVAGAIIKVTNCAIAVILVPFSCPSDHPTTG